MPVPPPVPAPQRYPQAIRDFVTYINQDGLSHTMSYQGTVTDLTLDAAAVTRDLEMEIISMEQTIGARPFLVPGQPTIGKSISWLSSNLSPGHVDARGAVNPLPPPSHNHVHQQCGGRDADDHPQYMPIDGRRPFIDPVTAPSAVAANQLITLAQAKNAGLTWAQVQSIIQSSLTAAMNGPYSPILGPDGRRWKMSGGMYNGYTDESGNIYVNFGDSYFGGLLSFVYMKMPFPGYSMLGWYNYQYMEDQLILLGLSNTGALIQFIEDIVVDRRANVCMTWMALGI